MPVSSTAGKIGTGIIDFNLKGIDGKIYSADSFKDCETLVIIFICNHCPYVKAVMDRLVEFQKKYKDKGVCLSGINPNDPAEYPEDSFENMKLFAEKYKMNFPYLVDETQETARSFDAVCTPDIYVYDKNRILKYRGRLDDSWKDKSMVVHKDLEKAVDLVIVGKEINFPQIPSMGCSIKWKK